MQPKWLHDCKRCRYIGSMHSANGLLDWYKCNNEMVARYGDDGPDYWSLLISLVNDDKCLQSVDQDGYVGYVDMQLLARDMLKRA